MDVDELYERVREALRTARVRDERTIERWMLGGMRGRLVQRDGPGSLAVEDEDDEDAAGELVVLVYPDWLGVRGEAERR